MKNVVNAELSRSGSTPAAYYAVIANWLKLGKLTVEQVKSAFVGLAAPHLVRAVAKVPHRQLMWLASLMGGALLCGADVLARWLIAPQELPVGVLTAVLGGGYLLWLMHRRTRASHQGGLL